MVNIGILGCSEIAFRRFMPAASKVEGINVVAVAEEYAPEKLDNFCSTYGIERESSFLDLIKREDIDAIYVPQPPALHYRWAKCALEHGKHVFVEKPSTTSYTDTSELVRLAKENNLALHENYMFIYHSQIAKAKELADSGVLGQVRLIRADFGFPMRQQNDFRYNKELGGGALLDAAGYPVRLATMFLGDTVKVEAASLNHIDGFEVDFYGSAFLSNEDGLVCQIGYGMDNRYRCSLEIWGSEARLYTDRIFTAPEGFVPKFYIERQEGTEEIELPADSSFERSIEMFIKEVADVGLRERSYEQILTQIRLIEEMRQKNTAE